VRLNRSYFLPVLSCMQGKLHSMVVVLGVWQYVTPLERYTDAINDYISMPTPSQSVAWATLN